MDGESQNAAFEFDFPPLPVVPDADAKGDPDTVLAADGPAADASSERMLHVEIIEPRTAGGLGVFLRMSGEQRLTRVAPVRDPRQPRFWCLAAFECSSCGIPVSGDAIWAGFWGSPQSSLAELLATIRKDAAAWLQREECAQLRALLLRPRPPYPLPLPRTRHELEDVTERAS